MIEPTLKILAFDVFGTVVDWRSRTIARALRFPFTPLVLASVFGAQSFLTREVDSMFKIEEAKILEGYRLWLRFSDGVSGAVDLCHLAGRGVFAVWQDRNVFESFHIDQGRALVWGQDIDLCADSLYLQLTGKSVDEAFGQMQNTELHA